MKKLIDIRSYPAADVLDTLLQDKSTKKNIIWATDTYEELGGGFTDKAQISKASLMLSFYPCLAVQQDEQPP